MRRNNTQDMTIVEQLVAVKEDICRYACKFKEDVELEYPDPITQKAMLQGYCHECPLSKIHYENEK